MNTGEVFFGKHRTARNRQQCASDRDRAFQFHRPLYREFNARATVDESRLPHHQSVNELDSVSRVGFSAGSDPFSWLVYESGAVLLERTSWLLQDNARRCLRTDRFVISGGVSVASFRLVALF